MPTTFDHQEGDEEEGEDDYEDGEGGDGDNDNEGYDDDGEPDEISFEYLQKHGEYLLIDSPFIKHLSEIHPVSAIQELTQRMGWEMPEFKIAFQCGPPMMQLFIYQVTTICTDTSKSLLSGGQNTFELIMVGKVTMVGRSV